MADPMECEPSGAPASASLASGAAALSLGDPKLRRRKAKKGSGWSLNCADPTRGRMHGMLQFWRRRPHSGERESGARRAEADAADGADDDAMDDDGAGASCSPASPPAARRALRGGAPASPARGCAACGSAPSGSAPGTPSRAAWAPTPEEQRQRMSFYVFLPYVVSGYLQLLVNVGVIAAVTYLCYAFVASVQADVDNKVVEYSAEALNEIAACSRNYVENMCRPDTVLPALKSACANWEACMNRDPRLVGRTKLSAETLAEIVNGFVEPISYKTMAFFTVFTFGFVALSNVAFHLARRSALPPALLGPAPSAGPGGGGLALSPSAPASPAAWHGS